MLDLESSILLTKKILSEEVLNFATLMSQIAQYIADIKITIFIVLVYCCFLFLYRNVFTSVLQKFISGHIRLLKVHF